MPWSLIIKLVSLAIISTLGPILAYQFVRGHATHPVHHVLLGVAVPAFAWSMGWLS